MTELIIDGVAVELPSAFSVSIKRENPFFTKSGEYTYDIELPLESSVNARLYQFLHRINSVADIRGKRRAVLIADNRVYLDGIEVITGWTDKNVKIQLISGNSELNYVTDEKTLLSSLRMRVTDPTKDGLPDVRYIDNYYPAVDFCLPMVGRPDNTMVNGWTYTKGSSNQRGYWHAPDSYNAYDFVPQPYLCAYIKNVIEALGYKLVFNALESTFARYVFLVHSQRTYDWSQMFPGMTVREFLEDIEHTFNVSFKIDFRNREVSVMLNNAYFFEAQTAFVQNVVDAYDCDTEDDDTDDVAYNGDSYRLSYDLPSSQYYREAALSQYVKDIAYVEDNSFKGSYWSYFDNDARSPEKIYKIPDERDAARYDGMWWSDDHHQTGRPKYHYVDILKEHVVGDGDITVKMPIIPAEVTVIDGYPCVVSGDTVPKPEAELKLDDILSMDKANTGDAGTLRMAFYKGLVSTYPTDSRIGTPSAFTDFMSMDDKGPRSLGIDPPMSLRPSEMAREFFLGGYRIDIHHPAKIKSFDVNLFDASSVFVINNKRFLCREIEYVISAEGRQGAWQGIFYPADINDTEMYKRWILADARWRDNGVWLDDGRWLDDKPVNHDKTNTEIQ